MKERSMKCISLATSLALHLGVIILLCSLHYSRRLLMRPVTRPRAIQVRLVSRLPQLTIIPIEDDILGIISKDDIPDSITPGTMKELIEEKADELSEQPQEETFSRLDESLAELRNMPEVSIAEIIRWFGLKGYEESGSGDMLDPDTAIVYAIEKKQYPDGEGYAVVFIDSRGVTANGEVPPDEVTEDWNALYRLYGIIEQNPKLEQLFKGIGIKVIGAIVSKRAREYP